MPTQTTLTFFSYAREDAEFALRLAKDLRTAGAKLWVDQFDIEPSARWDSAVEDALEGCPRLLVVLSPAAVASINVMDEVSHALKERKPVIPVLHRECKIPYRLHRLQHVDLRLEYETGFKRLLEVLEVAKVPKELDSESATAPAETIAWRSTKQIDLRLPRKRWNDWIGPFSGRFRILRGLRGVSFAVVLAALALYGSWRWLRSESIPGNSNMVVTCEPACKAGADFVLSVSNTGSTNLPAGNPGIARLGVLLPEPTNLEEWELTSDGNPPIPSGGGVPHYGSGDFFSHIAYPANDPLDFSTFQALSATAGVRVSSYNARAFSLGSFNTPGALITPIKSSKFSGATGFPPGTIFFAFLSNGKDNMRVINHTPSNALVVVRGAN